MVMLRFDAEGLKAFAGFVQKLADDYAGLETLSHAHFRDELHPRDYHKQQGDLASKDILVLPLREQKSDTERGQP